MNLESIKVLFMEDILKFMQECKKNGQEMPELKLFSLDEIIQNKIPLITRNNKTVYFTSYHNDEVKGFIVEDNKEDIWSFEGYHQDSSFDIIDYKKYCFKD